MTHVRRILAHMTTLPTNERGHIPSLTLGWRLRMSLADSGMSRAEMAAVLERSEATLTRWMHDKGAAPPSLYVERWAAETKTNPDWLKTGDGGHGPSDHPGNGGEEITRITTKADRLAQLAASKRSGVSTQRYDRAA